MWGGTRESTKSRVQSQADQSRVILVVTNKKVNGFVMHLLINCTCAPAFREQFGERPGQILSATSAALERFATAK